MLGSDVVVGWGIRNVVGDILCWCTFISYTFRDGWGKKSCFSDEAEVFMPVRRSGAGRSNNQVRNIYHSHLQLLPLGDSAGGGTCCVGILWTRCQGSRGKAWRLILACSGKAWP